MKLIILLSIFIYALSLNSTYYMDCKDGADDLFFITKSRCNQYNPDGGYCCYVRLEDDDDFFLRFMMLMIILVNSIQQN